MKTQSSLFKSFFIACLAYDKAEAIFFFQDMRPASYQEGEVLDIHVGQLFSN